MLLTALGCIRGRSCAAHTGYSGKRGRPNQRGSHEGTDNQPQAWWWIQCALRRWHRRVSDYIWAATISGLIDTNYILNYFKQHLKNVPLRKRDTSSSWGMLSSLNSQYLDNSGRFFRYSRQAWVGYNLLSSLYTTPHVFTSSSVNSIRGMGSPLPQ